MSITAWALAVSIFAITVSAGSLAWQIRRFHEATGRWLPWQ